MRKAITGVLTVALVALLSAVVYAAVAPGDDSSQAGGPTTTEDRKTTPGAEDRTTTTGAGQARDVSGPCDEAEHAGDARCSGGAATRKLEDRTDSTGGTSTPSNGDDNSERGQRRGQGRDDSQVDDVSGPCDEAEHANDPRCTGVAQPGSPVEDSGRRDDDRGGDHGRGTDDRNASGRGRGGDDDSSGRGRGRGRGGDDDSSGRG